MPVTGGLGVLVATGVMVSEGLGGDVSVGVADSSSVSVGVGVNSSSRSASPGRSAADIWLSRLKSRPPQSWPPKIAETASLSAVPSHAAHEGEARAHADSVASTTNNRPPPLQRQTTCANPLP